MSKKILCATARTDVNRAVSKFDGYEVIGEIDILSFIRRQKPNLVSFDGERAYTEHPEELAKVAATNKNYNLVFIPVKA